MADNFIAWQDWSSESFQKARDEGKLVLVNITSTWCATCRFMEDDTYEDKACIELINKLFIPIKVDSDKRPDINVRYNMGRLPTTLFLSPDGMLIWGQSYVAKEEFVGLLKQMDVRFKSQREKIFKDVNEREGKIREIDLASTVGECKLTPEIFRSTINGVLSTYDFVFGGFGKAPKFPVPDSIRVE